MSPCFYPSCCAHKLFQRLRYTLAYCADTSLRQEPDVQCTRLTKELTFRTRSVGGPHSPHTRPTNKLIPSRDEQTKQSPTGSHDGAVPFPPLLPRAPTVTSIQNIKLITGFPSKLQANSYHSTLTASSMSHIMQNNVDIYCRCTRDTVKPNTIAVYTMSKMILYLLIIQSGIIIQALHTRFKEIPITTVQHRPHHRSKIRILIVIILLAMLNTDMCQ